MIRELAKKLAAFAELVGCVTIELKFRRGKFESSAEILKNHSAMALVRVRSSEAELLLKLIRPRKEIQSALGNRIQSTEKIWRIFTASEIFSFADDAHDENKIFRFNPPIVPALLILETLCSEFAANFIKLKFKNFITAGEPLSLSVVGNRFEIKSAGVKKISGEFF